MSEELLPGQYFDEETNLHYNYFRYYDPSLGRYVTSDPLGLFDGPNTYLYAHGNSLKHIDPYGLAVMVCSQPAFGWAPIDHQWIKTDTLEAGMGPVGGDGNAGNESGDFPGDPVAVTDHTGRSDQEGVTCEEVSGVDEDKVNEQLSTGTPLGNWWPWNQCQTFVGDVLGNSR